MSGIEELKKQTEEILKALSSEERELLARVIVAEREKLHMKNPRNIKEDIFKAVQESIK